MRLILILSLIALPLQADDGAKIDAFARKAFAAAGNAGGMTAVVVKGDKIVYRGDFGFRDVEAKLPVTPDTRFYTASSTKAFTAMAAAILAEEGKLDLDAPITTYWKNVKFTEPLDASRFSLRDFLAMRPGLDNGTVNFRTALPANLVGEEEMLRVLAAYSRDVPRTFRYSNMSYVLAATVMEKATGKRWTEQVAEKILIPLGMTSTTTSLPPPGVPMAHFYRSTAPNVLVRTPLKTNEAMGPAGGMFTTSGDAAKWLMALMNEGRIGQRQVLPRRAVLLVQSPQTTNKARFRYIDRYAWGIGQDLGDYEGDLIVHRFGGTNGAYSHISFMPDHGIGVAVFASGGGGVADAVASYAYDLLLGKKDVDAKWSAELTKIVAAVEEGREERRKADARLADRKTPAHPLAMYAGTYHSDRLGTLTVTESDNRLYAQLGLLRAELVSSGGDGFLIDWSDEGQLATINIVFENERAVRLDWEGRLFERR